MTQKNSSLPKSFLIFVLFMFLFHSVTIQIVVANEDDNETNNIEVTDSNNHEETSDNASNNSDNDQNESDSESDYNSKNQETSNDDLDDIIEENHNNSNNQDDEELLENEVEGAPTESKESINDVEPSDAKNPDVTKDKNQNQLQLSKKNNASTLEEGVRHNDVLTLKKDLQTLGFANGMSMTNYYGSYTTKKVKDLQKYYGIKQTGKADKDTLKIIKDILNSPYLPGKRHQDIIPFKEKLNATEFGGISLTNLYGSFTEKRVKAFQKKHQLVVNGIGDPVTLKKLNNIHSELESNKIKIFIDAGHGGKDPGASGNGLKEKDLTLKIAKSIEKHLRQYKNVEVMMARSIDKTLSLKERTDMANKWGADFYYSVHINSFTSSTARGFETFVHPTTTSKNKDSQKMIHNEIMKSFSTNVINRGTKTANFHVLRESNMESMLAEYLFITNKSDSSLLKQQKMIDKIGKNTAQGIAKANKLKK
ncbi:MAG TPA: N-acetylmuramoyl-L-alanine amidase [Pseudogracilibacillus sp.]|nr:N-acetylmuramoyl-L-alanine amidase [Pseudogracilibacillus sp.]